MSVNKKVLTSGIIELIDNCAFCIMVKRAANRAVEIDRWGRTDIKQAELIITRSCCAVSTAIANYLKRINTIHAQSQSAFW